MSVLPPRNLLLWVDLEAALACASGREPSVTFKRTWSPSGGSRRDFMVGSPRVAAAVTGWFTRKGGLYLIWLSERTFSVPGGSLEYHSRSSEHLFGLPPGCLCLIKSRGSKSAEVERVWGIYDDRLQFMARDEALSLDESSDGADVSGAWNVWSSAAGAALADAYQFAGCPMPDGAFVLGRGAFRGKTWWL